MPLVTLPDGTKVNFAKTPTPADVEFAYKKVKEERVKADTAKANAPIDNNNKVVEKIADFTGGKEIGQGLGQLLAAKGNSKMIDKVQAEQAQMQINLINRIREKKAKGEDTTRLEGALEDLGVDMKSFGDQAEGILNPNNLTAKKVLGDALQLATTVISAGDLSKKALGGESFKMGTKKVLPKAIENTTEGVGLIKGALKGAKEGAKSGLAIGAAEGAASGLQNEKDLGGVLGDAAKGGVFGGISGGVLGGIIGGATGAYKGKKLRESIIKAQEESGIRPTVTADITARAKADPVFGELVKEAKKQGYTESDVNFLSTVSDADKPVLSEMFDVTAKAQSDPRQVRRAADILGENATGVYKGVYADNRKAGKAVDATAKALKGQVVDASPVRDRALAILEDAGVTADDKGLPVWDKSIFNKTPELQKKLMKTLSDLPAGEMDAYDLHKFKKSIDEVVEYGVGGEGLKGRSASILKEIRKTADDVLDSQFADYNAANTEFKVTRDFLDEVAEVVGTKYDLNSKQGAQAFGQAFRSAFSNNKSRPATLKLIEDLQLIAKQRGLSGAEQNLLDQAIYVNLLEDQFGSQATTGLAGEVAKGVRKVKGFAEGIRNPIRGLLDFAADQIEKGQNISPEMKKEVLKKFIK